MSTRQRNLGGVGITDRFRMASAGSFIKVTLLAAQDLYSIMNAFRWFCSTTHHAERVCALVLICSSPGVKADWFHHFNAAVVTHRRAVYSIYTGLHFFYVCIVYLVPGLYRLHWNNNMHSCYAGKNEHINQSCFCFSPNIPNEALKHSMIDIYGNYVELFGLLFCLFWL